MTDSDEHERPAVNIRRRRADRHPVLSFLAKTWIGLSTVASVAMAGFLALGFEFKTPASWLEQSGRSKLSRTDTMGALRFSTRKSGPTPQPLTALAQARRSAIALCCRR
jgi:hypothetical protein